MHAFKCGPSGWKLAQDTKFFPKIESTNEDWGGVSLYDLALKLLSTPPLANTLETVGVVAVGEDPEAALAGVGFLVDHLHADATHHVLAALHREWELHVLLMGLDAGLENGQRGAVRVWNHERPLRTPVQSQRANWKENCSQWSPPAPASPHKLRNTCLKASLFPLLMLWISERNPPHFAHLFPQWWTPTLPWISFV